MGGMSGEPQDTFETIRLERRLGAAWVTLDRPERLNATNERMHHELLEAFARVARDETVKALVITGAGERAFCIGSDLGFLTEAFTSDSLREFEGYLSRLNRVLFALEQLPLPTIAMVNGRARAGGFELILACDLVLIAEEASIGDVHTPYGHMPGAGGTQRASRKLGRQVGLELIWTGRWLNGSEAVAAGVALRAVPRAALEAETEALVAELTNKPREVLGRIKRCVHEGIELTLEEGIALEVHSYLEYLATSREPVERFLAAQRERAARRATGSARASGVARDPFPSESR
jgi:enoyl-CoA hydratase/carnithine racemase